DGRAGREVRRTVSPSLPGTDHRKAAAWRYQAGTEIRPYEVHRPFLGCLILLLLLVSVPAAFAGPADEVTPDALEALYRLDRLPRLRQAVRTGCVSSYDRTGGNDDGFSGKYSFIRKEGDGLVIGDLKGPGL